MDCTNIGPGSLANAGEISYQLTVLQTERDNLKEQLSEMSFKLTEMTSRMTEEQQQLSTENRALNDKYQHLRSQLVHQKEYSDKMHEATKELKERLEGFNPDKIKQREDDLKKELEKVREELGQKNIQYASLKVDVEKEELKYKKKCQVLEGDLEYEKKNSTRMQQELRRLQCDKMDTTVLSSREPRQPPAAAAPPPPLAVAAAGEKQYEFWSSGSGVMKEIRLKEAEVKVKRLDKENKTLKQNEEFYIDKAREWKGRALKYEKLLKENKVAYVCREDEKKEMSENVGGRKAEVVEKVKTEPARESVGPLQDVSNVGETSARGPSTSSGGGPPTPTENLKLVLSRNSGQTSYSRRNDYNTSDTGKKDKPDDCKTQ